MPWPRPSLVSPFRSSEETCPGVSRAPCSARSGARRGTRHIARETFLCWTQAVAPFCLAGTSQLIFTRVFVILSRSVTPYSASTRRKASEGPITNRNPSTACRAASNREKRSLVARVRLRSPLRERVSFFSAFIHQRPAEAHTRARGRVVRRGGTEPGVGGRRARSRSASRGSSAAMASPPEDYGAERALAPSAGGAVLFSPVSPAQAQAAALEAQLVQPTLFSYVANDLVWARASSKATDPFWPVRVVALGSLANGVVESKSIIRPSRDERASLPERRPEGNVDLNLSLVTTRLTAFTTRRA